MIPVLLAGSLASALQGGPDAAHGGGVDGLDGGLRRLGRGCWEMDGAEAGAMENRNGATGTARKSISSASAESGFQ